jgi:hypothetical protein
MELLEGGDVSQWGAALDSVAAITGSGSAVTDDIAKAALGGCTSIIFDVMAGM